MASFLGFPTGLFRAVTLFLELHWLKDPVGEEKQSLAESRKTRLSEVTKDLWVSGLLGADEVRASDVSPGSNYTGPGHCGNHVAGSAWMCLIWFHAASICLPLSLSTFAVEDDKQQSWPVFEIAWLTVLPARQTHRNYLLIGTAITIHYLLNLSACVILSNAFAPKKSHPLTADAVYCSFSFLELEERKRKKPFLWASVDSSLTCLLLEDAIKSPKVYKAYTDACIHIYMFMMWI